MITNSKITLYHKSLDTTTMLEKWTRYNFDEAWVFRTNGATINKGINESNNLEVRIPYFDTIDVGVFSLGDIIVLGEIKTDITTQKDLGQDTFNIVSINDNFFGNNPHIHLGCK